MRIIEKKDIKERKMQIFYKNDYKEIRNILING